MYKILNDSIVQKCTVKINYDNSQGTGFFISENIIVTAYHIFFGSEIDEDKIKIQLIDGVIVSGKFISYNEEYDLCLIKSIKKNNYLPIQSSRIKQENNWFTYGFPYEGESSVFKFKGTINQFREGNKEDFVINSIEMEPDYDYEGLSGAPVICDNNVVGIILNQIDNKLGAISIIKTQDYLKNENIEIKKEETFTEIPKQFVDEVKKSAPNFKTLKRIEESIGSSRNWILVEGTPGSGKTLVIAAFNPSSDSISIIGKYFVKIPNDNKPKSLRISFSFLLKWLEEIFYNILMNSPVPIEVLNIEKRMERLSNLFIDLNSHYLERDQIGVIFLDGLDEVIELEEFLNIIPSVLPSNIKIVLSCTSKEILPSHIKNYLITSQIIRVTPIDIPQCEVFINEQLNQKEEISVENLQSLAIKSEGHPLYLNYLVKYLNNSEILSNQNLTNWIDTIPNIQGDISIYYESIWDDFSQDNNKFWIILIFSQLRQSINVEDLYQMLPEQVQLNFYQTFPMIEYLLKGQESLELYHNSFKEFILKKAPLLLKDCNDSIANYCCLNQDKEYSIAHYIFHLAQSNFPDEAIKNCNQEWADQLANESIAPDLVISDIKDVIALSIKMENTNQVIRLLLLLQRIEFRYNYVLIEYATNIALALISNNKFKQALRYIVRRNILLIDSHDALQFLQLFYEYQAYEEANILYESIDRRFRNLLHNSVKGVSSDTFFMKGKSLILASNKDFEENYSALMNYQMFLKKMHDNIVDRDGENQSSKILNQTREYIASWNLAYQTRTRNMYLDIEKFEERTGGRLNDRWAKMMALTKVIYSEELNQYNTNFFHKSNIESKTIKDIEFLISNFGYKNEINEVKILIKALIDESSNTELVSKLIYQYLELDQSDIKIRAKNRVDLNYIGYYNLCFINTIKGYIGENIFPDGINIVWKAPFWESSLETIVEFIHYIEGKAYRIKSEGNIDEISIVQKNLEQVLDNINFTFATRGTWDNSYQIPEEILSKIFPKLIRLFYEFNNNNLDKLLDSLKEKLSFQFGLFSEGFRNCIFEIIKELIIINYDNSIIIQFVQFWEDHVKEGVQNRWERTHELLKISEVFGVLRESQKSSDAFKEMLNTSMGPNWYKEAQFDLLNSAMTYLKNDAISLKKYIVDFAALLDFASGEMTFQRYIRYDKESFITSLINNGEELKAIEYYKKEILPPAQSLLHDVEKNNFDCPTVGHGYRQGARNIVAQSAILNIIENVEIKSPYLKWALFEIFIDSINDEDYVHILDYSNILSEAINEISTLNELNLDEIMESVCTIFIKHNLHDENKIAILSDLEEKLRHENIKLLSKKLQEKDYTWKPNKEKTIEKTKKDNSTKNKFKEFNESVVKSGVDKNKLIKEGIKAFEYERISVWMNNWSSDATDARENLKNLFKRDKDVLDSLKSNILKFNDHPWVISKELIWFLEGKLSLENNEEILRLVNEHFHFIVRPTKEVKKKYIWLKKEYDNVDVDLQIIDILVLLLNHPY